MRATKALDPTTTVAVAVAVAVAATDLPTFVLETGCARVGLTTTHSVLLATRVLTRRRKVVAGEISMIEAVLVEVVVTFDGEIVVAVEIGLMDVVENIRARDRVPETDHMVAAMAPLEVGSMVEMLADVSYFVNLPGRHSMKTRALL